jgi:hypothetical protein
VIYSLEGAKLIETIMGNFQTNTRISTQSLSTGTYILIVETDKGKTAKTFIIQR